MESDVQKIKVIKCSFRYEICCALVRVFEWYSDIGPTTSQTLMQIHQTHGYLFLLKEAPQFAKVVDHIIQYVYRLSVIKNTMNLEHRSARETRLFPWKNRLSISQTLDLGAGHPTTISHSCKLTWPPKHS